MIDPTIVTGAITAIVAAVGTWAASRRINASNARKIDRDSDRDDFITYRETWEKERAEMRETFDKERTEMRGDISRLTDRVSGVEAKLVDEQRDSEALVDAIRMLLAWFEAQFPDHRPPLLPARVQQRLKEISS